MSAVTTTIRIQLDLKVYLTPNSQRSQALLIALQTTPLSMIGTIVRPWRISS